MTEPHVGVGIVRVFVAFVLMAACSAAGAAAQQRLHPPSAGDASSGWESQAGRDGPGAAPAGRESKKETGR